MCGLMYNVDGSISRVFSRHRPISIRFCRLNRQDLRGMLTLLFWFLCTLSCICRYTRKKKAEGEGGGENEDSQPFLSIQSGSRVASNYAPSNFVELKSAIPIEISDVCVV